MSNTTDSLSANTQIRSIISAISGHIDRLHHHPVYTKLNQLDNVITFMSTHIYCVWDFMNLLTTLQREFCAINVPWSPAPYPHIARFINELVLEESSDFINGQYTSHFSFYANALQTLSNTAPCVTLFDQIRDKTPYESIINNPNLPEGVNTFLQFSHHCIQQSPLHVAAAFTFGREMVIPHLFSPLVSLLSDSQRDSLSPFLTYLERHIALDSGPHRDLAFQMIVALCQTPDDWACVQSVACDALSARIQLWDTLSTRLTHQ
jgi:hypothetical protein